MKTVLINKKKTEIKNRVISSINTIALLRQDINEQMHRDVKQRLEEGYAIVSNIYKNNKETKSQAEINEMIKDALSPLRFFNGRGYYFISNMYGDKFLDYETSYCVIDRASLVDSRGGYPMRKILSLFEHSDEGFVSYLWKTPGNNDDYSHMKTSYVKKLAYCDMFIGVGEYLDAVEEDLKDRTLKLLNSIAISDDEHLLISNYDGFLVNVNSPKQKLANEIINYLKENNKSVFSQQYLKAIQPQGGYWEFSLPIGKDRDSSSFVGFVKAVPNWNWIIGDYVNESKIDEMLLVNMSNLYTEMRIRIIYLILTILFVLCLVLYISNVLERGVNKVFKTFYRELNIAVKNRKLINEDSLRVREYQEVAKTTNALIIKQREIFNRLEYSEQKFRILVKNLPIMIFGIDKDQKITIFNKAAQNFLGIRASAIQGKYFNLNDYFHDDVASSIKSKIKRSHSRFVLRSYKTKVGQVFSHEWNHFEVNNGEVMYVGYDLTEQYERETQITNQKVLLETLIDTMPLPIFYKGVDGVYLGCNKAYAGFMGKAVDGIVGKKVEDLYPGNTIKIINHKDTQLIAHGGIQMYETEFTASNKSVRHGRMYKALYADHTGENIGILGIAMDITDSVTYAKDLQDLNKTKDRFFSIIAHDLKNPFNSLIGLLGILREDYDELDDTTRKEYLSVLAGTTSNLYRLLTNLLEWSSTQTNTISYNSSVFNISDLLEDSLNLLKIQAEKKGVEISFNFKKNILVVADRNMILTIIRNLLNNAIKFTSKGGHINLEMNKSDNQLNINVKDTGLGMSQKVLEKLFRIDEKHSTLGTDNEVGTGLGLILCKEFIDKHSGDITVYSQEGVGSEFSVIIPQPV
jgi:PAS domain S-box-containing protein